MRLGPNESPERQGNLNHEVGPSASKAIEPSQVEKPVEKIVPSWVKTPVDVAGFAPVVGNLASIGSAGLSVIELGAQALKGDKAGMKEAAVDLAVDGASILATRGVGLAAKGAVKLAQAAPKASKVALVIEKGGALAAKGEAALGKAGINRDMIKNAGKQALAQAVETAAQKAKK